MRKFLRTKSSTLVASIFALGATVLTGCDNSSETKAVDRVEEAAALARVKDLEARADALKGNMPAANDITVGGADAASGKPSIKMPDELTIPDDEYGAAVRRGLQLANHTYKELPNNVGNQLNCTSCHLGNGSEVYAAPWNNMPSVYPIYSSRAGRVDTIQERINGCFERSMNGKALDLDSDDMNAMVSYMSWLSQDMPFGVSPEGRGFVKVDKELEPIKTKIGQMAMHQKMCVVN